jgi:hypothetical protein
MRNEHKKQSRVAVRERTVHLRVPFSISGRLGIGAEAWAELEQAEARGNGWRFEPTSGVSLNWRTFQAVMNALRHCGEKHYVNPPSSLPAAAKEPK